MEITVKKEDLSQHDVGGGYKTSSAEITVDKTLSPRLQRQVVIYEVLSLILDPFEMRGQEIGELTEVLGYALDQLDET